MGDSILEMLDSVFFPIAGGAALVLCAVLVYYHQTLKLLLDEMWAVDTYDAKELGRMVRGGFDVIVKVRGTVICDKPLFSPAANTPCCWFHTTVESEKKRTLKVVEKDSRGRSRTHTETYYEWKPEFTKSLSTIFRVHDQTGFVLVDPTKADIDTETARDEVVHVREPWFGRSIGRSDTGRYRIREEVFASEGFAYVLGQASETSDGALIRYPVEGYLDPGKKFFVISRKTEQELTRSKQIGLSVCFWFAILALLTAGFCWASHFGLIAR